MQGSFLQKVRNITKRQREIGNIEEKIAILQLKKAKFEEEERVARAEQNLESVLESESEHSSMRAVCALHQDHDDMDSLLNQSDSLLNQSDSLLNQSDTDIIIIRSLTTDLKSSKVRIIY